MKRLNRVFNALRRRQAPFEPFLYIDASAQAPDPSVPVRETRRNSSSEPQQGGDTKIRVVGWVLGIVGLWTAVGGGGPVLGHGWSWPWLAGGGFVAVAAGIVLADVKPGRLRTIVIAVSIGVVGLVGIVSSVVVGGKPVLVGTRDYRIVMFTRNAEDRIWDFSQLDDLLALDQTHGRLRIREMEAWSAKLNRWVAENDQVDVTAFDDPDMVDVQQNLAGAALAGVAAVDARLKWLKTSDPLAEQQSEQFRQSFVTAVLAGADVLQVIADRYQIPLGAQTRGPVE